MRASGCVAWALTVVSLALTGRLVAQNPDTLPAAERDSVEPADDGWSDDADTVITERRVRRHEGENPYLREVVSHPAARRRGDFWVGGSFGVGGEAFAAPTSLTPFSESRLAPTVSLELGGTVSQSLRLGLEGFVWFNPKRDVLETVSAAMFTGRLYPFRSNGLYLKSGVGFGRYGQDVMDDCGCSTALVSDYGLAWTVGAGFEAPVSRGLWIGPSVEMVRMNVTGPDGYRERVINVGISLTFDGKN